MHAWTTFQKGYAMQRDASDTRVNPDLILKAIEKDEVADDARTSRGHLKIFFGYAAGTGKTYAMLQAAHAAERRGVDVVAGYIEPHERPATAHLAQGLENVPCKLIEHNGIALSEFDLDAAIERAPQLILVDELAHTNAPAVPSSSTCLATLGVAALGLTVTALPPTRAMIGAVPASSWAMASSSATMSQ